MIHYSSLSPILLCQTFVISMVTSHANPLVLHRKQTVQGNKGYVKPYK